MLLHHTSLNDRLDSLTKVTKSLMECSTMKALFNQLRLCMKQMFNFYQLYIMIKADDITQIYKKKEGGLTHILTIDLGNNHLSDYL